MYMWLSMHKVWELTSTGYGINSGAQSLPQDAGRQLRKYLTPFATVHTPNVPEAKRNPTDARVPFDDPENVDDLIKMSKSI